MSCFRKIEIQYSFYRENRSTDGLFPMHIYERPKNWKKREGLDLPCRSLESESINVGGVDARNQRFESIALGCVSALFQGSHPPITFFEKFRLNGSNQMFNLLKATRCNVNLD